MMITEWWTHADCGGRSEPDPTLPDSTPDDRRLIAHWYCLECPVRPECAADARKRGDVDIIRGGVYLTVASRRQSTGTRDRLDRVIAERATSSPA